MSPTLGLRIDRITGFDYDVGSLMPDRHTSNDSATTQGDHAASIAPALPGSLTEELLISGRANVADDGSLELPCKPEELSAYESLICDTVTVVSELPEFD